MKKLSIGTLCLVAATCFITIFTSCEDKQKTQQQSATTDISQSKYVEIEANDFSFSPITVKNCEEGVAVSYSISFTSDMTAGGKKDVVTVSKTDCTGTVEGTTAKENYKKLLKATAHDIVVTYMRNGTMYEPIQVRINEVMTDGTTKPTIIWHN